MMIALVVWPVDQIISELHFFSLSSLEQVINSAEVRSKVCAFSHL